uniref:Uncharacterized protein n=1 Tax=Glossina austeni TaxID=7395 RepID=A0A1A9V213_GLOAU
MRWRAFLYWLATPASSHLPLQSAPIEWVCGPKFANPDYSRFLIQSPQRRLTSCGQHDSFAIMWSTMLLGLVDCIVVYLLYLSEPIDVVSRGFYSNRSKCSYRDADAVNVNEKQTPLFIAK